MLNEYLCLFYWIKWVLEAGCVFFLCKIHPLFDSYNDGGDDDQHDDMPTFMINAIQYSTSNLR